MKKISAYTKSFGLLIGKISQTVACLRTRIISEIEFLWTGVWRSPSNTSWIRIVKVLNLSVRTFLNKDLQSRAMALTYSTVLAIVPAFAMLFAIARGFGLQNIISKELYAFFPSQSKAVETAMRFVDSYLEQASQGLFVGVGIIFLLWTIISLLGNIEVAFNKIWDVKRQRTFYRKITDYTSICLLIPILMVCSAGVSLFMSTDLAQRLGIISQVINVTLDMAPFLLSVLAFTLSFLLIPNTKVQFRYALLSGVVCGIAFGLLQYLFMSGQIYVSKYNAIYGTFAFLPLLLIWLQLSWLILMFGCLLAYSAQNVFSYNYTDDITNVSDRYLRQMALVAMAIIICRHRDGLQPQTVTAMSSDYDIPLRLLTMIIEKFSRCGIIYTVVTSEDTLAIAPAVEGSSFTIADLYEKINNVGQSDFVPGFARRYGNALKIIDDLNNRNPIGKDVLVGDLPVGDLHK